MDRIQDERFHHREHREHKGGTERERLTTKCANGTKGEREKIARRGWRKWWGAVYSNPSGVYPYGTRGQERVGGGEVSIYANKRG